MIIYSNFQRKPLSKIWPSTDPKDIPFDEFTCNFCGKKLVLQSCGSYFIGEKSFEEKIAEALLHHLKYECNNDLYAV